jgi:hypothetical protein
MDAKTAPGFSKQAKGRRLLTGDGTDSEGETAMFF